MIHFVVRALKLESVSRVQCKCYMIRSPGMIDFDDFLWNAENQAIFLNFNEQSVAEGKESLRA